MNDVHFKLDDDAAGIGRGGYNVGVLPLREDALRLKASCAISKSAHEGWRRRRRKLLAVIIARAACRSY
jgi:hypothetical protein